MTWHTFSNLFLLRMYIAPHTDKACYRLKDLQGDWHEFESKALRKENERKQQEARRAARNEEHEREKAKRRASTHASDRDAKKPRPSSNNQDMEVEDRIE